MSKYICDRPDYVHEYYHISDKIALASTHNELDVCRELIYNFHAKYSKKVLHFWLFTWETDNKPAHSAYERLLNLLQHRRKEVYDNDQFL